MARVIRDREKKATGKTMQVKLGGMAKEDKVIARALTEMAEDDHNGVGVIPELPEWKMSGMSYPEWEEKQVARVELAMVQGFKTPVSLSSLLKLSLDQAKQFSRRVLARWELLGSQSNLKTVRGELIGNIELLNNRMWVDFSNTKDPRERAGYAAILMRLIDQRMVLEGLNSETINQILVIQEDSEVMRRIKKQSTMAEMAARLADRVAANRRALEAQYSMVDKPIEPATVVTGTKKVTTNKNKNKNKARV